jgi:hypothetical protein
VSTLSLVEQGHLSFWSIKTAIVFEPFNRSGDRFYSQVERASVLRWKLPPASTHIWIGRFADGYTLHAQANKLSKPKRKGFLSEAQVTTFIAGHLVIQVLTTRSEPGANVAAIIPTERPMPWDRLLTRIWPMDTAVISWPPPLAFGASGPTVDDLLARFTF